jgi:arginase
MNHETIAIIGCPYDEGSSFARGCSEAPPLIRAALDSDASNLWSESGVDLGPMLSDAGDLPPVPFSEMNGRIEASVVALLAQGSKPLILGGDHAISYAAVRAVATRHPGLTVLHFDAHPDLYDEFQGNPYSHACPFARIMEQGLAKRLVQVGTRAATGHQREQAKKFGVEAIQMKDWRGALPPLESPVYVSFDLDALDPAFAPGVGHREPGGLSVRQALAAIQAIRARVVAADIVEFNPRLDLLNLTATVAAKLAKELAAKMIEPGE